MGKLWIWLVIVVTICFTAGARHLVALEDFKGSVAHGEDGSVTIVAIHPVTNHVTLFAEIREDGSNGTTITDVLAPAVEDQLNEAAREQLDLYAWLVPYRAHVAIHLEPLEIA